MQLRTEDLTGVSLYPYLPGISGDFEPSLVDGAGQIETGTVLHHRFDQVVLRSGAATSELSLGVAYSWTAEGRAGSWGYCTRLDPLTLGVTRNWAHNGLAAPLLPKAGDHVQRLDALTDLVALLPSPNATMGYAQANLGRLGWIVMISCVTPSFVGILIEDPIVPSYVSEGTKDIFIRATSQRTLQSIELQGLTCAGAGREALFVKELSSC